MYVERREKLAAGAIFEGNGKRAAFALYYGALHFLTLRAVVGALAAPKLRVVFDLGCGTASAGAAWAVEAGARCEGVERNGWAAGEARWTLSALGLKGHVTRGDLMRAPLPGAGAGILAAFTANELEDAPRDALRERLFEAHDRGAGVLIVEPLSRRIAPWWDGWRKAFEARGGRADEWRFPARLPATLKLLDKAAGLDHRELTARSLWLPPPSVATSA